MTEFTDDMKYIIDLEEENRKLNEEIERLKQNIMQDELEIIPKLEKEEKKAEYTHYIFNGTVDELTRKFNDGCYRNFKIVGVLRREGLITVFFEKED